MMSVLSITRQIVHITSCSVSLADLVVSFFASTSLRSARVMRSSKLTNLPTSSLIGSRCMYTLVSSVCWRGCPLIHPASQRKSSSIVASTSRAFENSSSTDSFFMRMLIDWGGAPFTSTPESIFGSMSSRADIESKRLKSCECTICPTLSSLAADANNCIKHGKCIRAHRVSDNVHKAMHAHGCSRTSVTSCHCTKVGAAIASCSSGSASLAKLAVCSLSSCAHELQ